jgi:hypothetical protein
MTAGGWPAEARPVSRLSPQVNSIRSAQAMCSNVGPPD